MRRVLVAGRSDQLVNQLQRFLIENSDLTIDKRVISNGHADPLHGVLDIPSVLVLVLLDNSLEELEAFGARPASNRPPLVIIGNELDPQSMRIAMRAGARECLNIASANDSLVEILLSLCAELKAGDKEEQCQVVTVINASGGSGASMVAANLAHISAVKARLSTVLLDLDLQMSPLCHYFDLTPKHCLLDALERVDELDEVSSEAYTTKHSSGLRLFSAMPHRKAIQREQFDQALISLLSLIGSRHKRIVIDLPNQLDSLGISAIEHSDVIIVVVQQNLTSIRNATQLLDVLRHDLLINDEHLLVVVNRFNRNATLELPDLRRSLRSKEMFTVPNQYRHVAESVEIGMPMLDHLPNSAVTKALLRIERHLTGSPDEAPRSIIEKTLSSFLRN